MKVFKFGGASIETPERMMALLPIISNEQLPLLIIVSALGKTTNALEKIVIHSYLHEAELAKNLVTNLKITHLDYAGSLLNNSTYAITEPLLNEHFTVLNNLIKNPSTDNYDMFYDKIVCLGEIFSSIILSAFLNENSINNLWIDIRQVIRTDNIYRDATVDWNFSKKQAENFIGTNLNNGKTIVTQGFIGATETGISTTLGREGSDYTAALLAAMLKLDSVTIWKDVEGLLNADPKQFKNTSKIEEITYNEVIEMAFYGAQIIHPKTIKPLQNNNIPLYVKCFLNKELKGTKVWSKTDISNYPPLIVLKENQVLLQVTTKDFSFITEYNLSKIYDVFYNLKIKINIIQNAAISFVTCIDNTEEKVKNLIKELSKDYKVLTNNNVSLLTIRHYNNEIINQLTENKQILLKQETRKTLQVVMK